MEKKINRPYDDDISSSKKKISKKEKIGNLLHYLIRRFSDEIITDNERNGEVDIFGLTDDVNVLRDPIKVIKTIAPGYSSASLSPLVNIGKEIVKEIMPMAEPANYDYIFNHFYCAGFGVIGNSLLRYSFNKPDEYKLLKEYRNGNVNLVPLVRIANK